MKKYLHECSSQFLTGIITILAVLTFSAFVAEAATFTNSAQINLPLNTERASLYPSPITVSGLRSPIASTLGSVKVTINNFTHTIPSQVGMVLCGPTGVCFLLQETAGGNNRIDNLTYSISDLGATLLPPTAFTAGTYRPAAYALRSYSNPGPGNAYQNPGPTDGGAAALIFAFRGTNPNGVWNLFVQGAGGAGRIDGGWTLDIETEPIAHPQHTLDFDGDGKTDYALIRNIGSGVTGQLRWFINPSGTTSVYGADWGLAIDYIVPADYDGDQKTDIAVWRPLSSGAASGNAFFYILQSQSNTVRIEDFGQSLDDPTVVGDYNGDGRADVAVYRPGAGAGQQSYWFYRTTPGGAVTYVAWGLGGSFATPADIPAPGDYDGDGRNDFVVVRSAGVGSSRYWLNQTSAGMSTRVFGTAGDLAVPGDYDGDGKTDLAIARIVSNSIHWWYLRSSDAAAVQTVFGAAATDRLTQGDYDGDGKTDMAIWRQSATPGASAFWVKSQFSGVSVIPFGQSGDYPVANFNVH